MFDGLEVPRNELVIRLQPDEAIYMKTNVKRPGLHTQPVQASAICPDEYNSLAAWEPCGQGPSGRQSAFERGRLPQQPRSRAALPPDLVDR